MEEALRGGHEALAIHVGDLLLTRRYWKSRRGPILSVVRDAEQGSSSLWLLQF